MKQLNFMVCVHDRQAEAGCPSRWALRAETCRCMTCSFPLDRWEALDARGALGSTPVTASPAGGGGGYREGERRVEGGESDSCCCHASGSGLAAGEGWARMRTERCGTSLACPARKGGGGDRRGSGGGGGGGGGVHRLIDRLMK